MRRSGVKPDSQPFPGTMPWQNASKMTDNDLAALYAYLTTEPKVVLMNTYTFRSFGFALLINVIVFLIGASAAAYFRRWPLPTDPLDKLTLIANDRVGWTAQAVLFLVAYLATAVLFALIAAKISNARGLAGAAAILFAVGFLCWLVISIDRLQLGVKAAELIRTYDPAAPPEVMVNFSWVFWANTLCILAALALMGAALAVAGVLPTLGWVVMGTAVASASIATLIWGDWPPFMSYILVLILALGLIQI